MRRIISLILLLLAAFAAAAFAVGGGGGGGGGYGGSAAGGSSGCSGICELACLESGAITFRSTSTGMAVTATSPSGKTFNVTGFWSVTKFESEEALFNESGLYAVNDQSVSCPGLGFSCKLAEIRVESCAQDADGIRAVVSGSDLDTENLRLDFLTSGNKDLYYTPAVRSSGLAVDIAKTDKIHISAAYTEPLARIQASDTRCTGRYLVADSFDCANASISAEKEYKCFDLLNINERIRCRLSLTPAEQEAELQLLYLPEQCRAVGGAARESCVRLYKSFQPCYALDSAGERVLCAKKLLGVGDLDRGRFCADRNNSPGCGGEFNEQVFSLIIFRFYELEERAEEWLEQGRVSLQDASDFIALVELQKVAFSQAESYEGRRTVILAVRDIWRDFVGAVG